MRKRDILFTKYVGHRTSRGVEYFVYRAVVENTQHKQDIYFELGGVGTPRNLYARTLNGLLEKVKEEVNISSGKRTDVEIELGQKMTQTHHKKAIESIENQIEMYGGESTAEEWVEEKKR